MANMLHFICVFCLLPALRADAGSVWLKAEDGAIFIGPNKGANISRGVDGKLSTSALSTPALSISGIDVGPKLTELTTLLRGIQLDVATIKIGSSEAFTTMAAAMSHATSSLLLYRKVVIQVECDGGAFNLTDRFLYDYTVPALYGEIEIVGNTGNPSLCTWRPLASYTRTLSILGRGKRVTLKGFNIDGSLANAGTGMDFPIVVSDGASLRMEHCQVRGFRKSGVLTQDIGASVIVHTATFHLPPRNNSVGVWAYFGAQLTVFASFIGTGNSGQRAVYVGAGSAVVINGAAGGSSNLDHVYLCQKAQVTIVNWASGNTNEQKDPASSNCQEYDMSCCGAAIDPLGVS